jgi:hypothetical protein
VSVDEPAVPEVSGAPFADDAAQPPVASLPPVVSVPSDTAGQSRSEVPSNAPNPTDAVLSAADAADAGPVDEAVLPGEGFEERPPTSPVVAYAGAFVAGFALGLVGAIVAASRIIVRGVTVPVGLVLVLAAVLAVARGMAWFSGSRRGAAFVALGWVLPTLAYLLFSPGGDVLLPDVARTTWYLLGSAVLLVAAMAFPLPRGAQQLAEARRSGRVDPPEPA